MAWQSGGIVIQAKPQFNSPNSASKAHRVQSQYGRSHPSETRNQQPAIDQAIDNCV
jgi:hypothetical protein